MDGVIAELNRGVAHERHVVVKILLAIFLETIWHAGKENLNPLGLANMLGTVWEWCQDWYSGYQKPRKNDEVLENPTGPKTGLYKIRQDQFKTPMRRRNSSDVRTGISCWTKCFLLRVMI